MDRFTFILAFLSMVSWGVGSFLSKLATNRIGEKAVFWDVIFYLPAVVVYCLFAYRWSDVISGDKIGIFWAALSGFIGSFGLIFFYIVISRKDASQAIPLTALYPAFASILAILFLKESVTIQKVLGIAFATLAIVLLSM